jgi:hypothetical protein
MTDTPRERLAAFLQAKGIKATAEFAHKAGITTRHAANALTGRPVATVPYLRICAALGFDPLPELSYRIPEPADFDFAFFAMGFKIARGLKGDKDRTAADAIGGISASTICRIELAHIMGIGVVLRACRYIGLHPFGYLRVPQAAVFGLKTDVSRGTPSISKAYGDRTLITEVP